MIKMLKKYSIIIFIIIGLLLIFVPFICYFGKQDVSNSISDWASFGGYISGGFGIISISLIYLTYQGQRKIAYKNQFESIFFEMLKSQRTIYCEVNVNNLFSELCNELASHFNTSFEAELDFYDSKLLLRSYFGYHVSNINILHYFRHLYHIVKYVHLDNFIGDDDKKKYIDVIQSEMNDDELFLTFFNVVWYDNTDYLKWLDEYSFFENMKSRGKWFDCVKDVLFHHTKWKHYSKDLSLVNIVLDEEFYRNENWYETLERLKKEQTNADIYNK